MRTPKATIRLLLSAMLLLPVPVSAQVLSVTYEGMLLAPPPGPYVSSRPQLESQVNATRQSTNRMPFIGNIPAPAVPMHYPPSPRQVPAPPRWFYGPMGR